MRSLERVCELVERRAATFPWPQAAGSSLPLGSLSQGVHCPRGLAVGGHLAWMSAIHLSRLSTPCLRGAWWVERSPWGHLCTCTLL